MKVIVIGGGPAGMMAAITAAEEGNQVILIEKNDKLGKKLLITGKGRCNITSSLPIQEFIQNVPGNGRFLYSAFQNYTNQDVIDFLKKYGLRVKEERGNRIFPVTDCSKDVLEIFLICLKNDGVKIEANCDCKEILTQENRAIGICYQNRNSKEEYTIFADKIILATGGKSYPQTGSNGDGYILAQRLGHQIIKPKPSLVPFGVNDNIEKEVSQVKETTYQTSLKICQAMQGLNLKNVKIRFKDQERKKVIYDDFGEMLFTHFGVSGPTILSASSYIRRYTDIEELLAKGKIFLEIDLKPALSEEQLENRIQRDFMHEPKKHFANSLDALLPRKMIEPVIALTGISPDKKVCEISKKEILQLVQILKKMKIQLKGFRSIEEAIITAGGVDVKQINPKTMESKLIENLYFAGEMIDVDAYTGGFNLQIAYSTGVTAGKNS